MYQIKKSFTYGGKRYYVYGKTEKDAIMKMANKLRDLEENKVIISTNITVKDWAYQAVDTYKPNLAEITRKKFINRLKYSILNEIGDMRVKDVKPVHCQNCLNNQIGKSKAQIDAVYQALQFIFRTAKENKIIYESPAEYLVRPKGYKNGRRAITSFEREHLLNVCPTIKNGDAFLFMLYCGCRPSEAYSIKYNDFIKIENKPMLHIRGTKTAKSDRIVPCPLDLFEKYNKKGFDFIFKNEANKPLDEESIKRLVKRLYRAMNISMGCKVYRNQLVPPYPLAEDFVPYCLRHTFCTDLAKNKIDIRVAQKLMGHSTIQMTADIYTHVSNDDIIEVGEKLYWGT